MLKINSLSCLVKLEISKTAMLGYDHNHFTISHLARINFMSSATQLIDNKGYALRLSATSQSDILLLTTSFQLLLVGKPLSEFTVLCKTLVLDIRVFLVL